MTHIVARIRVFLYSFLGGWRLEMQVLKFSRRLEIGDAGAEGLIFEVVGYCWSRSCR